MQLSTSKLKLAFVALLVLLIYGTVASRISAQSAIVTLEGQVVNLTLGATADEGLTVTLHRESPTSHDHLEVTTDAEGRFEFEPLVPEPTTIYGVSIRYGGALYGQDLDLADGNIPPPMLIELYEPSSDISELSAATVSILFAAADKGAQRIAAMEIVTLINNSDRAFVPGTEPMNLVRFGLPADAIGLSVDTRILGADFAQVDRGFAILGSIPPGNHEILYTYEFPYESDSFTFTKNLRYGANSLRILSPEGVLDLSGAGLGELEQVEIGERPYQLIHVDHVDRGDEITIQLTGLPIASLQEKIIRNIPDFRVELVAPIVLGVLLLGVVAFAIWRRRRSDGLKDLNSILENESDVEQQTLMGMIEELERTFRSGDINERDYMRRRRVLESRLGSLSQ